MTPWHPFAPRCGYCGTFLSPFEKEVALRFAGEVIVTAWPHDWRPMCQACYDDETPEPQLPD